MPKRNSDKEINPIIRADYPDPDVIRVQDTYYMISTTMHFMPGGVILRSYDLVNWEIASYIFDQLDDSPKEKLLMEQTNYAGGMWAASLRYHEGRFYAAFVSHYTETTYLFTAISPTDKWEKHVIEGYYHDCSLLFDDDGRKYIVYGNRQIHLLELNDELTGPKEGGINRILITDDIEGGLGHEGSHIYKINNRYYLFTINWPQTGKAMRTQNCFMSTSLEGEFKGGVCMRDDRGFFNQGVAQGGIVDTPNGKWYAVLFQDSGAVGRMPILVPISFGKDGFPIFGVDGRVPEDFEVASSRPYYRYEPVYTSDDFIPENGTEVENNLKLQWQWNHRPDYTYVNYEEEGGLRISTGRISTNLIHANNCLTQRMLYPKCEAEVSVDARDMKNGDIAGLCTLLGGYGYLAITKEAGTYYLIKVTKAPVNDFKIGSSDFMPGDIVERIRLKEGVVTLCLKANFENLTGKLDFYYLKDDKFVKVGATHSLEYRLDHFTGARFGLFIFSTNEIGGSAVFRRFLYRT